MNFNLPNKVIFSFIIYFIGAISLVLLDVFISGFFSDKLISDWASLKSFILMFGGFLMLGANNMVIRYPEKNISILKYGLLSAMISSCLLFVFMVILKDFNKGLNYVSATLFYSIILYFSSNKRANFKIVKAQLFQNLWKVLLALSFVILYYFNFKIQKIDIIVVRVFLLAIIFVFIHELVKEKSVFFLRNVLKADFPSKELIGFGLKFVVSLLTASSSAYLEVFLISNYSSIKLSSLYFSHFVAFTALATFSSGFIGFLLTPLVRKSPKIWGERIIKNKFKYSILALVGSFILSLIIAIFFEIIFNRKIFIDLAIIITIISTFRIIYILPTSILGGISKPRELNNFLIHGVLGIVIMLLIFFLGKYLNYSMIYVISIASLINWLIRTSSAFYYAEKVFLNFNKT